MDEYSRPTITHELHHGRPGDLRAYFGPTTEEFDYFLLLSVGQLISEKSKKTNSRFQWMKDKL